MRSFPPFATTVDGCEFREYLGLSKLTALSQTHGNRVGAGLYGGVLYIEESMWSCTCSWYIVFGSCTLLQRVSFCRDSMNLAA